MNIFYTMSNGLEGLNKLASGYLNDADTLTGLFYGMLKEAARTNRNGRHASAVRGRQVLDTKKLSNMKNALERYEKDVPRYLDDINALKATTADLTRTIDANNATMFNLRGDIDRLVKDKDAMRSGYEATIGEMRETAAEEAKRAKRKLQIAQILNNRRVRSLEAQHAANATALATKLDDAGRALTKSNRLGKFKLAGGLLGGIGLGAGGLALASGLRSKPTVSTILDVNPYDKGLQRTLGYTGGGAALGGLIGALSSDENRVRNGLIGALLGGASGYAFDKYGHKPVADMIKARRNAN